MPCEVRTTAMIKMSGGGGRGEGGHREVLFLVEHERCRLGLTPAARLGAKSDSRRALEAPVSPSIHYRTEPQSVPTTS